MGSFHNKILISKLYLYLLENEDAYLALINSSRIQIWSFDNEWTSCINIIIELKLT